MPECICHVKVNAIQRSAGRSVTAAVGYRDGEKIKDLRTGDTFDYTRKKGVEHAENILPKNIEKKYTTEELWNAAELAERKSNSVVGREYVVAIPCELDAKERKKLAADFAAYIVGKYNVAANVAIHAPGKNGDERNYHAHIMTSTRVLTPEGFGEKTRVLDVKQTGHVEIMKIRQTWAELSNQALEKAGSGRRMDARSFRDRGLERLPEVHLGPAAAAMERRGIHTERGDHNREIRAFNELVERKDEQEREARKLERSYWETEKASQINTFEEGSEYIEEQYRYATFEDYKAARERQISEIKKQTPVIARLDVAPAMGSPGDCAAAAEIPADRTGQSGGDEIEPPADVLERKMEVSRKVLTVKEAVAILDRTANSLLEASGYEYEQRYKAELARLEKILEDKKIAFNAKKPSRRESKLFGFVKGESEEDYQARLAKWEKDPLVIEVFRIERGELDTAAEAVKKHKAGKEPEIRKLLKEAQKEAQAEAERRHPEALRIVIQEIERRKSEREEAEIKKARHGHSPQPETAPVKIEETKNKEALRPAAAPERPATADKGRGNGGGRGM
jgi:hypothetical protein